MFRRIMAIVLTLVLLSGVIVSASAAIPETVAPLWNYTNSLYAGLPTIDPATSIADCCSTIAAKQYLPVKVVCELQWYVGGLWATIKSWEAAGTRQTGVQNYHAVNPGYWYRVKTTGYVYSSNNVLLETSTVTTQEQYFSGK